MNSTSAIHDILGLSRTERDILNALSAPKNVRIISGETGISRTGVNYCLDHLAERGFIRILRKGKRRSYVALTDEELMDELQRALDGMRGSNTKRQGARIKTSKEDEFIIHVGVKEIIPAYERIASENKDERIRAIQHHRLYNKLLERITPKQLVRINETIKKNRLIIDGILNESAYNAYKKEIAADPKKFRASIKSLEGRMADYSFFRDDSFDHDSELWLFKDTSLLINWHEEVAIEITNRNMTAFLKDMFSFVKEGSRKIDHNRAMRDILKDIKD